MAFNPEEEARLAEEAKRIAAITDETARDAALAKAARSSENPAEAFDHLNDALKVAEEEAKAAGKHTLSAVVGTFNTAPGMIRSELSAGFDSTGFTGAGASVATGLFDGKTFGEGRDFGAASVVLSGGINNEAALGDPNVALRYVSPTLINDKDSAFEAVAIGVAGANIPTDGREFTAKDVALAAGGVLIHKDSGAALTSVLGTDATFNSLDAFGRVSGNVWENDKTRVDLNVNGGYNTGSQEGRAGVGVFVDHKLDSETTVYGGINAGVGDVGGKNALGGGGFVGVTFDMMPVNSQAQKVASEPVASAATSSDSKLVQHNLDYDFRSLSKADQKTVIGFMTEATGKPEAEIREQLAKANFKVNAHNTESYLDDTPQQRVEQVATR